MTLLTPRLDMARFPVIDIFVSRHSKDPPLYARAKVAQGCISAGALHSQLSPRCRISPHSIDEPGQSAAPSMMRTPRQFGMRHAGPVRRSSQLLEFDRVRSWSSLRALRYIAVLAFLTARSHADHPDTGARTHNLKNLDLDLPRDR